jgi:hypothetical protein
MKTVKLFRLAGALAIVLAAAAPTASMAEPPHAMPAHYAMSDHMPPSRFEHIPPMPHHNAVWHKGHWRFERGQWIWFSGMWLTR